MLFDHWKNYDTTVQHEIPPFAEIGRQLGIPNSIQQKSKSWCATAWKVVAMILLPIFMVSTAILYFHIHPSLTGAGQLCTVTMHNGDRGELTLPDGSKLYLNSATTVSYAGDFGKKTRTIWLKGEALLHVAKDKTKPFLVETRDMTVKVLGTTFNVRAYEGDKTAETTLIEGSVNILTKGEQPQTISLKPRQKASVNLEAKDIHVEPTDFYDETAWRSTLQARAIAQHASPGLLKKEIWGQPCVFYSITTTSPTPSWGVVPISIFKNQRSHSLNIPSIYCAQMNIDLMTDSTTILKHLKTKEFNQAMYETTNNG